jgi:hypothetical protein
MIGINTQILYNININMNDYKPISKAELERGYFLLTHKLLIKKLVFGLIILVFIIFYGVLIFKAITYFRGTGFSTSAMQIQQSTFNWANYHSQNAPEAIEIGKVSFISLGDRRYNIVALVENTNADWTVKSLDYHFVSQGVETPIRTAFINPEEKRLLSLTAYESDKAIRNPELVISNIEWYRIDGSFPEINIETSNIKFQAASRETVDGVTIESPTRVSWDVFNDSVYNFWEIDWQIALYNGDTLVAINELKTKDFVALETRSLETVWLNRLARVTRATVFPILDKLDKNIFKNIYADPEFEIR